jgi:hypothetical protein
MSTGNEKRQRKRSTRVRRSETAQVLERPRRVADDEGTSEAARQHYQREKERRAARIRPPEHPLEQARRAYHALLAADAERAKGGRPKKGGAPVRKPKTESTGAENEE